MDARDTIDVGSKLGEFAIERVLGKGGMGVVYKAHEPSLNRKVALKVLSDMLSSNEEYITRFKKEAQIVAALNHPNIVRILTFGKDLGRYYFAMEYIKGKDLGQILKAKTVIPLDEAMSIARQIAGALSEAGRKGVVHRDLKPSNIMIDEMDRVRVTDFGVARLESATDGLTQTGMFLGTPEYASPEQATGKPIDTRSDIYALGALLYRMLSGKPPIVGDSPLAVVAKIATEPVTPIGMLNSSVPKPVCELIDKMMAKDLGERYQTPGEVCAAIDAWVKGPQAERESTLSEHPETRSLSIERPVPPPTPRKSGKKRYWVGALLAATVFFLAVAMIGLAIFKNRERLFEFGYGLLPTAEAPAPMEPPAEEAPEGQGTETLAQGPETVLESAQPVSPEEPVGMQAGVDALPSSEFEPSSVQVQALSKDVADASLTRVEPDAGLRASPAAVQPQVVEKSVAVIRPESPTVLLLVTGPEDMRLLMRSHLAAAMLDSGLRIISPAEIPMLRERVQVGDMPISWYDIHGFVPEGAAHTLVLASIERAGTANLNFYGQTRKQVTAVFSIRTLDVDTGESIRRSATGQVKYTALNMTEKFEAAVDSAVDELGADIKADWRSRWQ